MPPASGGPSFVYFARTYMSISTTGSAWNTGTNLLYAGTSRQEVMELQAIKAEAQRARNVAAEAARVRGERAARAYATPTGYMSVPVHNTVVARIY